MHHFPVVRLAAVLLILVAVGCAGSSPGASAPSPSDPPSSADPGASAEPDGSAPGAPGGSIDGDGDWLLIDATVDGAPIELSDEARVTLSINGTQVTGTSACNGYGGKIVVENGVVRFGDIAMTMMGCEEPAMSIETAYHAALGRVRLASLDGDALVLAGDGVSLRFEPIPPVPTAELVETLWTLDTLITTDVATSVGGEPATLRIASDLSFEGSTGCRSFSGRFAETGGELTAVDLARTDQACAPELVAQDAHVTSVLGDGFRATIDGERLTLTAAGGQGLGYTTAE